MAVLCKVAIKSEYPNWAVIYPENNRLLVHTLRFGNEVKDNGGFPDFSGSVSKESLDLFRQIVRKNEVDFSGDLLVNDREEKFNMLLSKKLNGEALDIPKVENIVPKGVNPLEQLRGVVGNGG
jgi:non-homologous end joining protein Ku